MTQIFEFRIVRTARQIAITALVIALLFGAFGLPQLLAGKEDVPGLAVARADDHDDGDPDSNDDSTTDPSTDDSTADSSTDDSTTDSSTDDSTTNL
ncbi:MAG: hypothetical protein IIC28_09230 [Chloroflexi bacterium]|nr:hypothetical protein [Chloroflexota bacterium]